MFSNLSQNSILYIFDVEGTTKILSGPVERVTVPRPRYRSFSTNMEMVVDIIATINGEKREFKEVPNGSVANFESFVVADSKESLNSYINSMLQNSKSVVNSVNKHNHLIEVYEEALQELNPSIKADKEKDKAIQTLQDQVSELKELIVSMTKKETKNI